jgi:AcrR family transcriptional regulator
VLTDEAIGAFRERAVEIAMRLFAEQGYEGFSLRTLARELGCSHTTPYRYFPGGKDEIFAAVRAEGFRRFGRFLERRLEPVREPLERVRVLARAYFDFSVDHRAAFTIIFEMGQPNPDEFPTVGEAGFAAWSVLYRVIEEAAEAGALVGDVSDMAHTMWAGIHGVATLHLAHKITMDRSADAVLHTMTDALIHAYVPREERDE